MTASQEYGSPGSYKIHDLVMENGDFKVDFSDYQHVEHILSAAKGDYLMHPITGYNANRLINGIFDGSERRELAIQLLADGYPVVKSDYDKTQNQLNLELDIN